MMKVVKMHPNQITLEAALDFSPTQTYLIHSAAMTSAYQDRYVYVYQPITITHPTKVGEQTWHWSPVSAVAPIAPSMTHMSHFTKLLNRIEFTGKQIDRDFKSFQELLSVVTTFEESETTRSTILILTENKERILLLSDICKLNTYLSEYYENGIVTSEMIHDDEFKYLVEKWEPYLDDKLIKHIRDTIMTAKVLV